MLLIRREHLVWEIFTSKNRATYITTKNPNKMLMMSEAFARPVRL
jgi:hypothetical protein